jgi:hypothetical protein
MPAKKPSRTKKRSRKRTQTSDPEQYARFLEMAKKLETDESGEAFQRAIDALVTRKAPDKGKR